MDFNTSTNPETEAPEAEAPEVETPEDELEFESDDTEAEAEVEADGETPHEEEEFIEVERDGKTYRIPKAAEPLLMFQQDYTRKTQDLAEQRRELETRRQASEWEEQTRAALFNEEAQLYQVRQRLEQFSGVNWQAVAAENPQQAVAWQAEYTQLKDIHDRLSGHVEGRKSELAQKREQEAAITYQRAVEHLNRPRPELGWAGKFDADKRASLTQFGMELGFTNEELSNTSHPLMIQTLNLAKIGYETLRKQSAGLKKATPEAKPVPQVAAGKTKTGPFNPDKLPPEQWMKWRETQLSKKQQRSR